MNHDYAHCIEFTDKCPKNCFRAELARDLQNRILEFAKIPISYASFIGTEECCKKNKNKETK